MPERVQEDPLVDPGRLLGAIKGASQLTRGERVDRVLPWEQPASGQHHAPFTGRQPPGPLEIEERLRQREDLAACRNN